jgi:endonuclease I
VRYEGGDSWPDLEVDDVTGGSTAPRLGRLSALLAWSAQDPPDAFERHRNEVIYTTYQHNRNPFIDHPEWVASIFG